MIRIIIAGGGWAGCAAAVAATRSGASVILIERTDQLLGTGLAGGIMRNNGRYTAAEELIALGGGDLIRLTDRYARHRHISFPGHDHATIYDLTRIERAAHSFLTQIGVTILTEHRLTSSTITDTDIDSVTVTTPDKTKRTISGDCFIDCTGTAGPGTNCTRYGRGCVMCILRCPTFGGRISLAASAGITELTANSSTGSIGVMSGSCAIDTTTIRPSLRTRLSRRGVISLPLPEKLVLPWYDKKACEQYEGAAYRHRLIILDNGHAKLMVPFIPRNYLHTIPGLERASFIDPLVGSRGNSMRFFSICPRTDTLQVTGITNLLCAGEKTGPIVGHTEAILTGTLAGHNAVRLALGKPALILPSTTVCGDFIAYTGKKLSADQLTNRYTFSGASYFRRMKAHATYTTDKKKIRSRIARAGLTSIFLSQL